jgi:uncharacterized protein YbaP (TraB family)
MVQRFFLYRVRSRLLQLALLVVTLMGCTSVAPLDLKQDRSLPVSRSAFLWQVQAPASSRAAVVYLYGTIHLNVKTHARLLPVVQNALENSSILYLELDPRDMQQEKVRDLVEAKGFWPAGISLRDKVAPQTFRRLMRYFDRVTTPKELRESMMRMRPWMAALTLQTIYMASLGADEEYGSEAQLQALAAKFGKPVAGLETPAYQMEVISAGSDGEQEFELNEALDIVLDESSSGHQMTELLNAYQRGDVAAFAALATEYAEAPLSRSSYERLVVRRNEEMAQKIKKMLSGQRRSFVAVGALHLMGPSSILETLQKEGLVITHLGTRAQLP